MPQPYAATVTIVPHDREMHHPAGTGVIDGNIGNDGRDRNGGMVGMTGMAGMAGMVHGYFT